MDLSGVTTTRQLPTFSKSFQGLPNGSFPTFKGPFISQVKTPLKCLTSCLLTFNKCHFTLSMGPQSKAKAEASLPANGLWPLSPAIAKIRCTQYHKSKFPHSPSHLNCPVPTFSLDEWVSHGVHDN